MLTLNIDAGIHDPHTRVYCDNFLLDFLQFTDFDHFEGNTVNYAPYAFVVMSFSIHNNRKRVFYKMYFFYSTQRQVSWQSEWITNVIFRGLLTLHKMRNASSLPRLDDVIETIEDLQSNPSSRRTTYRYVHIILNLENNIKSYYKRK